MLMSSVMISVVHSVWVVILIYVNELCYDLCSSTVWAGSYMLMSSVMISVVHSVWGVIC